MGALGPFKMSIAQKMSAFMMRADNSDVKRPALFLGVLDVTSAIDRIKIFWGGDVVDLQ